MNFGVHATTLYALLSRCNEILDATLDAILDANLDAILDVILDAILDAFKKRF